MVDYLEQGKTITGDYYASLLVKLRDAVKDKRRGSCGMVSSFCTTTRQATAHASLLRLRSNAALNCCCRILPILPIEPGSTLIVDLIQVQVMIGCTNVKLRSADVVQLNHDFEPWLYVLEMEISGVTRIVVCPVQYIAWDTI